jgi:UDP-N-acetyl-2-amino-2-deoxyglucuronate dehydrogenase
MKNFNYGLIGCGAAGKVHAYYFSSHESIGSIFTVDENPEILKSFTKLFNPRATYSDYKGLFDEQNLDVVSVSTPPFFHKEQVFGAAKKGASVLCEKPLATNLVDAREMVRICNDLGVTLGVMLPRRFYNNSRAVKEVIERGELGDILEVSFNLECYKDAEYYSTWRGKKAMAGGGVLMSQSIHSIDQLVYLFGKPVEVRGNVRITRDYLEIEDEAKAEIRFASGIMAKISATANSEKTWQGITTIVGKEGKIILDSAETLVWEVPNTEKPLPEENEPIPSKLKPGYYGPGHMNLINDFISSISEGMPPYVVGEDCLEAMKIIFGIYKSSGERGRWIELSELE